MRSLISIFSLYAETQQMSAVLDFSLFVFFLPSNNTEFLYDDISVRVLL